VEGGGEREDSKVVNGLLENHEYKTDRTGEVRLEENRQKIESAVMRSMCFVT